MKPPRLRWSAVFVGGLTIISVGFASSVGLRPADALLPVLSVVGGLVALTAMMTSGSGPRGLL
jgi:hypothetical protein